MDRNFGLALALCFGVFIIWFQIVMPALYPPQPKSPTATGEGEPGTIGPDGKPIAGQPGGANNPNVGGNGNGGAQIEPANPGGNGAAAGQPEARTFNFPRTAEQEHQELTLTNDKLQVVLSSSGGAVASVTMVEHAALVNAPERLVVMREFETLVKGRTDRDAPFTTPHMPLRMRLGGEYDAATSGDDLATVEWEVIDGDVSDHVVAFAFAMGNGLRIVRRYSLEPADAPLAPGATAPELPEGTVANDVLQHRLYVEVTFENFDTSKLRYVKWEMSGPTGIAHEQGQRAIPYGLAGWMLDGSMHDLEVQPLSLEGGEQPQPLSAGATLRYVGVANPYFVAALVPKAAEPVGVSIVAIHPADQVIKLRDRGPPLVSRTDVLKGSATELGVLVRHESRVPKAQSADAPGRYAQSYHLVVTAKIKDVLVPLDLDELRQGGWMDWLAGPMLAIFKGLHWLTGSWGIGVVILTLFVRVGLHPFQKRAQISMHVYGQKMKRIQPELAKIKQIKDVQKQRQAQMELMQKHQVRPPLGCLMMVAQIPVFIAVYQVFLYSVELRHASFLFIADLSQPDHLIPLPGGGFGPIPFLCCASLGKIAHINIVPIIWIFLMQLNHKFSVTKMEDMTEQQQQQMKMMRYMTPLFGLMFWNIAAAAGMYILISTTWGMIESRFIRREIARRDELEAAGGGLLGGSDGAKGNIKDAEFVDPSIKKKNKKK